MRCQITVGRDLDISGSHGRKDRRVAKVGRCVEDMKVGPSAPHKSPRVLAAVDGEEEIGRFVKKGFQSPPHAFSQLESGDNLVSSGSGGNMYPVIEPGRDRAKWSKSSAPIRLTLE